MSLGFLVPTDQAKRPRFRMLLGLIRPSTGHIRIFGLDTATHLGSILPRLGAIVEGPTFYPYLSGRKNLRSIAAASGMRLGKFSLRRIDEMLDLVDLRSQANDAYRTYSLGMKQRLAIAAALLTDPELILLDEPTNGLDPAGVHEIRQMILRLAEQGKTIFLSSHVLFEVQQVCNRVAILHKGNLVKQGNVRDLLRQGAYLVVRLDTSEQTEKALSVLEQARRQDMTWIKQVNNATDEDQRSVLHVNAPVTHASEISALLGHHQISVAELYPSRVSLETFFLEQTAPEAGRPGVTASAADSL